ncbi:uncharacterized protein LOC131942353 [Physella acuta]|uniref:uncharacterized protein LOC131942353 n=1 Tax=Physella acuta TaxID=109671 RepID=UPI0027DE5D48|nr:uncharacterized protein LOC131942353 [Physella acuta]XP_059158168.1 uncharacterized protein LOC131942353 [Physella acuta]
MRFLLAVMLALLVSGAMPGGASDTDGNEGVVRGVRQATDQDTDQGTNKTTEILTKLEEAVNGKISAALDQVNKFFLQPNREETGDKQKRNWLKKAWRRIRPVVTAVGVATILGRDVTNADAEVTPSPDSTFPTAQDIALTKQALNILWTAVTAMETTVNQSANQKS